MNGTALATTQWATIDELCDRYLGGHPAASALQVMKLAERERPEVRDFVERIFRLMQLSRFRAADISPIISSAIGLMLPGLLPGAWGGSIPPFTWEQRHKRIDQWLTSNRWASLGAGTLLLEMGCGFPPLTAIDAAAGFPDWKILGADVSFDEYLVRDQNGNYACLNSEGDIRYFHCDSTTPANLFALYQDRAATIRHFSELFRGLLPKLPSSSIGDSTAVSYGGAELVRWPLQRYEQRNLKFVQAGIGSEFERVEVIRCFNVLIYFDESFRRAAEEWALRTLRPGGLFLCGADAARTMETRYAVYRSEGERLVSREFAFSIDNVRPFTVVPWFVMHEGESDAWLLARLVGKLRSDDVFRSAYDSRLDQLFEEKRFLIRDRDGLLVNAPSQVPASRWLDVREEILVTLETEGFAEQAAAVLRRAGISAWCNSVGHVAVNPATIAV